ncbi:MAG: hypothetical protein LBG92_11230 [Prevotellaceae bacterium]|jgi:hypothetical protein|nr:hypothetical protein [Prevotellaceae bacterium]
MLKYKTLTLITSVLFVFNGIAQQVRLDNLKEQYSMKNLLKINGGVSANAAFYNGNNAARDPFTWVLSGNLNMSLFNQFSFPFSFNFNNLGGNYTYPTLPNRISLNPVYKWATGHFGDVSMSFSPYTLNGHQFTGAGVELAPDNLPLKVSAMYGRLVRATEYNPEERLSVPAYKRTGYGIKTQYSSKKYSVGMTLFSAKDFENSLQTIPDSLEITPQSNLAASLNLDLKLIKNLTFIAEYGISLLTHDIRIGQNLKSDYHAVRAELSYQFKGNTIGLGYERIDPEYRSLGAYYFTNDLENFTVNFARSFLKDKLTFAMNVGMQHDNLDNSKAEESQRFVGAASMNASIDENLNISLSYSNFQTYTNTRSQFDYINKLTEYDNLDTLNFTQLSQNAIVNVSWNFGNSETYKHNLGLNLNWQEAADKRGNMIRTGGASQLYNIASAYSLTLTPLKTNLNASANLTYNTVGFENMLMYGPNLGISTNIKRINAGASIAYNITVNNGKSSGNVLNMRANVAFQVMKRHNLSIVLVNQNRNFDDSPKSSDFTLTFGYFFSF